MLQEIAFLIRSKLTEWKEIHIGTSIKRVITCCTDFYIYLTFRLYNIIPNGLKKIQDNSCNLFVYTQKISYENYYQIKDLKRG